MKVFISWSNPHSQAIALALGEFLQKMIQALRPYISTEIDKGNKWSEDMDAALEGSNIGIVCLTPDNLDSPWIHFEAGAVSKVRDVSKVCTFLVGLVPSQVKQPLSKFQATVAEKDDVWKLVRTLNQGLTDSGHEALNEASLKDDFEMRWKPFHTKLQQIEDENQKRSGEESVAPKRSLEDMTAEVLEIVRGLQRRRMATSSVSPVSRDSPRPFVARSGKPFDVVYHNGVVLQFAGPGADADARWVKQRIDPQLEKYGAKGALTSDANEEPRLEYDFAKPLHHSRLEEVLNFGDDSARAGTFVGWTGF